MVALDHTSAQESSGVVWLPRPPPLSLIRRFPVQHPGLDTWTGVHQTRSRRWPVQASASAPGAPTPEVLPC